MEMIIIQLTYKKILGIIKQDEVGSLWSKTYRGIFRSLSSI